jgi:cytochrome c oxidase assembly factor CtaG
LLILAVAYVVGWDRLASQADRRIKAWRGTAFLAGLFLLWLALGSPLVAYDHHLLTAHMVQHLLLMTIAPALILLGEPLLVFWPHGTLVKRLAPMLSRWPALCWIVAATTLVGWHVPAVFARAMQSEVWHSVEQSSFLVAGFLFWWPVVQPWPTASTGPHWSTLLYLFLASLPCDALSGFLVFSDRVAYPAYFFMPRHFGLSVLEDQQCAAALMWTCVTLVYLIPAAILSTRLLSPRSV